MFPIHIHQISIQSNVNNYNNTQIKSDMLHVMSIMGKNAYQNLKYKNLKEFWETYFLAYEMFIFIHFHLFVFTGSVSMLPYRVSLA